MPQYKFWIEKASRNLNRTIALETEHLRLAVCSIFDKKALGIFQKRQSQLRRM